MDRTNHYEAAFEEYLRERRLCYVAVDESRRSLLDDGPIKSLDFIVYGPWGSRLLVDIKGRRFPGGTDERPRRVWENWSTEDDIAGLLLWARRFGDGYRGLLVFAYEVMPSVALPPDTPDLWVWRSRQYLFRAVPAEAYRRQMRRRSPRWGTVCLPGRAFRELVRPFRDFADAADAASIATSVRPLVGVLS